MTQAEQIARRLAEACILAPVQTADSPRSCYTRALLDAGLRDLVGALEEISKAPVNTDATINLAGHVLARLSGKEAGT